MNDKPWVKQYHPDNFSKIYEQTQILNVIQHMIEKDTVMNMMFVGPMGVGKSSTADVLSKSLYGANASLMTLRLNASDSRGINDIRNVIQQFAEVSYTEKRLIILDEADSMTLDAQLGLRKIIDNHSNRVRFCLICNYMHKIHPAILSRTIIFYFMPVQQQKIVDRLREIMILEKKIIQDDALGHVAKLCQGDMRQAIHLLYSLSFLGQRAIITTRDVYEFTGNIAPDDQQIIDKQLEVINKTSFRTSFDKIYELVRGKGYHLYQILRLVQNYIHRKRLYHLLPKLADIDTRLSLDFSEKAQLATILYLFA